MTILQHFENAGDTMAAPAEVAVAGGQKILQPIWKKFLPILSILSSYFFFDTSV